MKISTKLEAKVLSALPKGKPARILWQPTGIGRTHVLRVVTPAWKTLPRWQRNFKLQEAIRPHLTAADLQSIFRISVMTSPEFNRLRKHLPTVLRAERLSAKPAAARG